MAKQQSKGERAIANVEAAVTGDAEEARRNAKRFKDDDGALRDKTAHTRVAADAADDDARPDPDARTDIGASDDIYKRTRGLG